AEKQKKRPKTESDTPSESDQRSAEKAGSGPRSTPPPRPKASRFFYSFRSAFSCTYNTPALQETKTPRSLGIQRRRGQEKGRENERVGKYGTKQGMSCGFPHVPHASAEIVHMQVRQGSLRPARLLESHGQVQGVPGSQGCRRGAQ